MAQEPFQRTHLHGNDTPLPREAERDPKIAACGRSRRWLAALIAGSLMGCMGNIQMVDSPTGQATQDISTREVGTLSLALTSTVGSDQYRLRAHFEVAGRGQIRTISGAAEDSLLIDGLPIGTHTVQLLGDYAVDGESFLAEVPEGSAYVWDVQKKIGEEWVRLPAALVSRLSPAMLGCTVVPDATSNVTFRFEVEGQYVPFDDGAIHISSAFETNRYKAVSAGEPIWAVEVSGELHHLTAQRQGDGLLDLTIAHTYSFASPVTSVAQNATGMCLLHDNGDINCYYQENGPAGGLTPSTPVQAIATQVVAADGFFCALRPTSSNGTIACWTAANSTAARVQLPSFGAPVTLTAHGPRACATDTDGEARCWTGPAGNSSNFNHNDTTITVGYAGDIEPRTVLAAHGTASSSMGICTVTDNIPAVYCSADTNSAPELLAPVLWTAGWSTPQGLSVGQRNLCLLNESSSGFATVLCGDTSGPGQPASSALASPLPVLGSVTQMSLQAFDDGGETVERLCTVQAEAIVCAEDRH